MSSKTSIENKEKDQYIQVRLPKSNWDEIEELMDILNTFKRPRDMRWLIAFLKKKVDQDSKKQEKQKEYFQKNKPELYQYHQKYREDHPEYRQKRRELARQKYNNGKD